MLLVHLVLVIEVLLEDSSIMVYLCLFHLNYFRLINILLIEILDWIRWLNVGLLVKLIMSLIQIILSRSDHHTWRVIVSCLRFADIFIILLLSLIK